VPNFTAILIHEGNDADDSEGCILVGRKRETDFIGESKLALKGAAGQAGPDQGRRRGDRHHHHVASRRRSPFPNLDGYRRGIGMVT
jgi:Family of unknown function (DUF5675)